MRNFVPVALVATLPSVLTVHPDLSARNPAEFIALARARPSTIEYGTAGNGAASHITMVAFADAAGIEMVHVPYCGNGQMLADFLTGRVRDGRPVALGMSAAHPSALLPGIPPVAQALLAFKVVQWPGLVAPAATPPAIVARINALVNDVLGAPELVERLATEGAEPALRTPEFFGSLIREDVARFRALI